MLTYPHPYPFCLDFWLRFELIQEKPKSEQAMPVKAIIDSCYSPPTFSTGSGVSSPLVPIVACPPPTD